MQPRSVLAVWLAVSEEALHPLTILMRMVSYGPTFLSGYLNLNLDPNIDVSVYCGTLPELTHGNYSSVVNKTTTEYPYLTQYTYTCEKGFNATIRYSTNCSEAGEWEPAPGCHQG